MAASGDICDITATLESVKTGPVALSMPPVRTFDLTLSDVNSKCCGYKGIPEQMEVGYSIRSNEIPEFHIGSLYNLKIKQSESDKYIATEINRL
ncbi:hypothetical protein GJ496_007731 [Pomphorhynchus laevis]|nr:hypothetical protein GJ496_007731 [Pomphorhynchus laevis]